MGWLFSTEWQSKAEVMNECSELTQDAKDKGWELVHAKLCRGGFALGYKNGKTGEMSISYHLTEYGGRNHGYGEKCVTHLLLGKFYRKISFQSTWKNAIRNVL